VLMEFKTKKEFDNFVKGNERHFSNKRQSGQFELFVCNVCLSHFDNEQERNFHKEEFHDESGWNSPSSKLGDSDFKKGGDVY
jgi:hypothetical protein